MKRFISLPGGMDIEITDPPENLEDVVGDAFAKYTSETARDYIDEDRLSFIDTMIRRLNSASDSWSCVQDLIKGRFDCELSEYGRLMDKDEFYTIEFFSVCWEDGLSHAQLRCRWEDRHKRDAVNRLLARIIRTVMLWEPAASAHKKA